MQDGSAGSTGEEMEQLFSYLSRLNLTTKNMTAAGTCQELIPPITMLKTRCFYTVGREEHITEAVRFWNRQKVKHMPRHLKLRLQKVCGIVFVG